MMENSANFYWVCNCDKSFGTHSCPIHEPLPLTTLTTTKSMPLDDLSISTGKTQFKDGKWEYKMIFSQLPELNPFTEKPWVRYNYNKIDLNMKEENKYFTPDIEDIRVGYECEVAYLHEDNWTPAKVRHQSETKDFIIAVFEHNRRIRTSYLTKEQIEKNLEMSGISCIFDSDKCILKLYDDKNTYFYGLCKSVNELRQLLEYIKSAI